MQFMFNTVGVWLDAYFNTLHVAKWKRTMSWLQLDEWMYGTYSTLQLLSYFLDNIKMTEKIKIPVELFVAKKRLFHWGRDDISQPKIIVNQTMGNVKVAKNGGWLTSGSFTCLTLDNGVSIWKGSQSFSGRQDIYNTTRQNNFTSLKFPSHSGIVVVKLASLIKSSLLF